jgi:hypothetical protein
MTKLNKLSKVNDSFTINRYDNGFMVEINGRNYVDDWVTAKILCNTEEELIDIIKEYNSMELS